MANAVPSTVVITGASSGIGRQLALEYARRGARVLAIARREDELGSLCAEIEGGGGKASYLTCDVAEPEDAYAVVKKAEEQLGTIDMLIANAGVGGEAHATRYSLPDVLRVMRVNVEGAVATLMGAIPIMLAQKHGHLVGVTSLAGRRVLPAAAPYCASKAALSTFLEGMRIDLAPAGIKVSDVQPGFVDTPMTEKQKYPMPFKWGAPKAARYIADTLESAPRVVAFPFPLTALTLLSRVMPFRVYSFVTLKTSGR